jgi:hypothetical protein
MQNVMVAEMKKVIDTIPWEDGEHLLADFEGERSMLFGDKPELPCATIEVNILEKVYLRIEPDILEKALYSCTTIVGGHCRIPLDRIFAFFNPIPMWAWEGINIEKTILADFDDNQKTDYMFQGNYKHQRCGI